ncbi:MAG: hypothetical protein KBS81_02065 [Spirochaetales bacterium]|nr:hypothetical protein [Candidatus Physcosoma equi]
MVIYDPENICCWIYEVKHSSKVVPSQYRHLVDEEKCRSTSFRYGTIRGKTVLYSGVSLTIENGIQCKNVDEYLKELSC